MIGCDSEDAEADLTKGANQDVEAALLMRPASKGPLGGLRYLQKEGKFSKERSLYLIYVSKVSALDLSNL